MAGTKGHSSPMFVIQLRLAAGGWVPVCRSNAEALYQWKHIEVQVKSFSSGYTWIPMDDEYTYKVRMLFRARTRIDSTREGP